MNNRLEKDRKIFETETEDVAESKFETILYNLELTKKWVIQENNVLLLEFGCLHGLLTKLINEKTVAECKGLDIVITGKSKNIQKYDGKTIPFKNKNFDGFTMFEVIEHLNDPINSLKELNRVTKLNGRGIITTPNKNIINSLNKGHNSLEQHIRMKLKWNPETDKIYSYKELEKMFYETGFKIYNVGRNPYWVNKGFKLLAVKVKDL